MPKTKALAKVRETNKTKKRSKAGTKSTNRRTKTKVAQTPGQIMIEGMKEALAYARGEVKGLRVDVVERPVTARDADASPAPKIGKEQIVQLRQSMNLSQPVFARALNATPSTVRSWEQGVRVPNGPALRLLEIAAEHPHLIIDRVRSRK